MATQTPHPAWRVILVVLAAILSLASAGCATAAAPHVAAPRRQLTSPRTVHTTPRPTQTPSSQVPVGVFTDGEYSEGWSAVAAFGAQAGQQVRYVLGFLHDGQPFPEQLAVQAAQHGAELVLQVEPDMSLQQVLAGADDGYLTSLAEQVAEYRHPVILSWAPEANGNWYSWGYTQAPAQSYQAAWAHVIAEFTTAPNVAWMDTINVTYEGAGPTADYIVPGASVIGIDGYFEYPGISFSALFGPTISQIRAVTDKPIVISETAISQASNQIQAIPDLVAGVQANHLAGFIWFNEDLGYLGGVQGQNWTLTDAGATVLRQALQQAQESAAAP